MFNQMDDDILDTGYEEPEPAIWVTDLPMSIGRSWKMRLSHPGAAMPKDFGGHALGHYIGLTYDSNVHATERIYAGM